MVNSTKQQQFQDGSARPNQTCKTLQPSYKTSSLAGMSIDGLSWAGASWQRSLKLAEEEYKSWQPK